MSSKICKVCKSSIDHNATDIYLYSESFCSSPCRQLEKAIKTASGDELIRLIKFSRGESIADEHPLPNNAKSQTDFANWLVEALTAPR